MQHVSDYASYLVRLWQVAGEGQATRKSGWRAEVESIQSGESWRFDDLDTLVAFFAGNFEAADADEGGSDAP